jgi:hypothetical protein
VPGFEQAWTQASPVGGWLTRDQGEALWAAAATLPRDGLALEIGSHQGRSTIVLAAAARERGARVIAVDPFVEGRLFGGSSTRLRFEANLDAAGLREQVRLLPERSTELRPQWDQPLAMLYIDGKHDYWTVRDDLRWVAHLPEGAPVLVHDAFSSIGVTLGLLVHVLPGTKLRYDGRTGSLARLTVAPPGGRDRLRMLAQLPWFVRNVLIKVALRLARVVGYRGTPDPY